MKLKTLILTFLLISASLSADWDLPGTDLSATGQNANGPTILLNSSNHAVATWTRFDGSNTIVQAAYYDGSSWSSPVDLSAPGVSVNNVQLAYNDAGTAIAAWIWGGALQVSFFDGSSWSSPQDIYSGPYSPFNLDVALNESGQAVIIWNALNSGTGQFIAQASTYNGSVWSSAVDLNTLSYRTQEPKVGIDASGNALAIWYEEATFGSPYLLQSATFNGSSWSSATNIFTTSDYLYNTTLSMNSSGQAIVGWVAPTTNDVVQVASWNGSSWSSPEILSATGQDAQDPDVAINDSGDAIIAWVRDDTVQTSSYDGSSWSAPQDLSGPTTFVTRPIVALNSNGFAVIGWEWDDGSRDRAQATTFDGTTWSTPVSLSAAGQHGRETYVSINDSGTTAAIWDRRNGSHFIIQAAFGTDFFPDVGPLPPSNLTGIARCDRFLTQKDYVNILNWTASTDTTVVGYRVYLNGSLVATVNGIGSTEAVIHNRKKGRSYTYSVVSFNGSGIESAAITVTVN